MQSFEYTVIPAPARGEKTRAAKTPADRYAHALTNALNGMAAQGWEYVRAETLPSEERSGLTGRTTVWMNVLVFRRALAPAQTDHPPAPPPVAIQTMAAQAVSASVGSPVLPTGTAEGEAEPPRAEERPAPATT